MMPPPLLPQRRQYVFIPFYHSTNNYLQLDYIMGRHLNADKWGQGVTAMANEKTRSRCRSKRLTGQVSGIYIVTVTITTKYNKKNFQLFCFAK